TTPEDASPSRSRSSSRSSQAKCSRSRAPRSPRADRAYPRAPRQGRDRGHVPATFVRARAHVKGVTPMNTTNANLSLLSESQKGPAEKLLDLVLGSSAHLWHNRPGLDLGGTWHAKRGAKKDVASRGTPVAPGLFVPAAERLYARLVDVYSLN